MIASVVYLLCALTSLLCTVLLIRSYKETKMPLLFWTSASFAVMALANLLLFVDLVIIEDIDLLLVRTTTTLVAVVMLLYGLVMKGEF